MKRFYDTNALLDGYHLRDTDQFYICNITKRELEQIKTNPKKDIDVKKSAQHLIEWMLDNQDKYETIYYDYRWDEDFINYPVLIPNSSDSRIIMAALHTNEDFIFTTHDFNCAGLAEECGLKVEYTRPEPDKSTGYKVLQCNSDEKLADFYNNLLNPDNPYDLKVNEYILIQDKDNKIIDAYRYVANQNNIYLPLNEKPFESSMFGKVKPKDIYQKMAIDSLTNNQLTMLKGPAGSGKSFLSLSYLFDKLEHGKIDKIIIFCNTVAVSGSAKLGFLPGDKNDKLLDSQIGNFLASKFGDRIEVERMIEDRKLLLLPMADLRGYDTTNMNAGIYITEAQNMTIDMMKLALQRAGEDCIFILDGDPTVQVDMSIYAGNNNGMKRVSEVFTGYDFFGEVALKHIYRSRMAEIAEKM